MDEAPVYLFDEEELLYLSDGEDVLQNQHLGIQQSDGVAAMEVETTTPAPSPPAAVAADISTRTTPAVVQTTTTSTPSLESAATTPAQQPSTSSGKVTKPVSPMVAIQMSGVMQATCCLVSLIGWLS